MQFFVPLKGASTPDFSTSTLILVKPAYAPPSSSCSEADEAPPTVSAAAAVAGVVGAARL